MGLRERVPDEVADDERPRRIPRSTAQGELPLLVLSFMSESRRMDNTRMKRDLGLKLRHETVLTGLLLPNPTS